MDTVIASAIAANRFGLGARPGELAQLNAPQRWLREQLRGGPSPLAVPLPSTQHILAGAEALADDRRAQRKANASASELGAADAVARQQLAMKLPAYSRPLYVADAHARLQQLIASDRPFVERLTLFWSNHFAVSVDKLAVLAVAGAMEREAIRPHVLGRFATLLRAVEQHPAMILYLDNQRSTGADAPLAVRAERRGRELGLNENLAREILELHTLGVDGGYTQADVTAFARVITGWSIGTGRDANQRLLTRGTPGQFLFRPELHEPGAQQVVGRRFAPGGVAQGEAVLDMLAVHPSTARHLATKLARHFVADDPPPALVERLAGVWQHSGADLSQVYAALIDAPEAWVDATPKFKTPTDYMVSIYRGLALPLPDGQQALGPLEVLGQRQFAPGSPAGWPDRSADWDGAAALNKRIEYANAVARRVATRMDPAELAPQLLGGTLSDATRRALAGAATAAQGLTLLLASPEFLRR
ncbi:MAG: DUF1800 domain-containing protein [Steroidobacteraceae bacterium]